MFLLFSGKFVWPICDPPSSKPEEGYVISGRYPNNYPAKQNCPPVSIRGETGMLLELTLLDLKIQKSDSGTCPDYLKVTEAGTESPSFDETYCGDIQNIQQIDRTFKKVSLAFKSNKNTAFRGFVLKYSRKLLDPHSRTNCDKWYDNSIGTCFSSTISFKVASYSCPYALSQQWTKRHVHS